MLIFGCNEDVIEQGVEVSFVLNSSPTFEGYYYLGSDANFHFFVSEWAYSKDQHFKVTKSAMFVRHELKRGSIKLRLTVFNQLSQEKFAHYKIGNKDVSLYVEKEI